MSSTGKTSKIVNMIYKSRNILLSQLKNRGIDVSEHTNVSISDVYSMNTAEQLDMLLQSPEEKVYVKYVLTKGLRANLIHDIIEELFEFRELLNKNTDSIIFITKSDPNDTILKIITQLWDEHKIYVNVVNIKRLMFNILEHDIVPPHRVLTDVETQAILQQYNVKSPKTQLPTISRYDPVAIAIGLRPGKVCEIIRPSPLTITTKYYRVCV